MKRFGTLLLGVALISLVGCPNADTQRRAAPGAGAGVVSAHSCELLGTVTGKTQDIIDAIIHFKELRAFDPVANAARRPQVFATMPARMHNPDGMTVSPFTGTLFLTVPNFNRRLDDGAGPKINPAFLVSVSSDGTVTELLNFNEIENIQTDTGQIGPMGLVFCPVSRDLYVADNHYFFDSNWRSRVLRVLMDGDVPTGEVQVVVEGTKLSNAVLWCRFRDDLFITDTQFDIEGVFGSGGVWRIPGELARQAGRDGNPPIQLEPVLTLGTSAVDGGNHPFLLVSHDVEEVPGGGDAGADGITVDSQGVMYFGNFGDGKMYRIVFDAAGTPTMDVIHPAGEWFNCCDGIIYDRRTGKVFIVDSAANAIHAFVAPLDPTAMPEFMTIWENGNTDGADGLLDQPAEAVLLGNRLIIANFDWPFPMLLNDISQDPATLSVIMLDGFPDKVR